MNAIRKGNLTGNGLFGRLLGLMNPGGINRIGPSRLNFGGIGRWMFKKIMMKSKGAASLEELRQTAIDLGVKLWACEMSMDIMEITREDLIPEDTDYVGAAAFVAEAAQSQINLTF